RAIPLRDRTIRLPADPAPGGLHGDRLPPRIPGPTDALLLQPIATLVRRRRKSEQPADLAAVPKFPPDESFIEQPPGGRRRHAFDTNQPRQRARVRRGLRGGLLLVRDLRQLRLEPSQPLPGPRQPRLHLGIQRRAGPIPHRGPPLARTSLRQST